MIKGKKRFSRIYIEITNVCNMSCSFCIGNMRAPRRMSIGEYERVLSQIKPYADYIYLHVLGEPLTHPELSAFLAVAGKYELKVSITTNGTLLSAKGNILLESPSVRKVSVSVHSMESKDIEVNKKYIKEVAEYALLAVEKNQLCELRMWNLGVDEISNINTAQTLLNYLGIPNNQQEEVMDKIEEKGSVTLKQGLFLGKADRFEWPSLQADRTEKQDIYCHGLRSQLGILSDGTVVPCCLDSNGDVNLGNVFHEDLGSILLNKRAVEMYDGFSSRIPTEELCRRCGYATRF